MGRIAQRGRRYYRILKGVVSGYARYVKTVDADENTVGFVQEIYDDDDHLISIHVKYPEDTGHQDLTEEEDGE